MLSNVNIPPSQRAVVVGTIDPVSQAAGTAVSDWVSMADFDAVMAILKVGALGASATVDAKLRQATDGSGTGAKDISGKAITQLTKAGSDDNKQVALNVYGDDLDRANGFTHVALSVTVATAACLIDATLLGFDAKEQPGAAIDSLDESVY